MANKSAEDKAKTQQGAARKVGSGTLSKGARAIADRNAAVLAEINKFSKN